MRSALVLCLALILSSLVPACGDPDRDRLAPPAAFSLAAGASLPPNSAIASLAIFGERSGVALMNSFGAPFEEAVIPFDPLTGALGPSATARVAVTFSPPLPNSAGTPVSTTFTSLPAFAAASSGKLYATTSNFVPGTGDVNPGTVLVWDYDVAANRIGSFRGAIPTTFNADVFYNPTYITTFVRPGETERLAVVCAAPYFTGHDAAVLVIDPAAQAVAEAVTIGATTAGAGEAALGPDLRLYVGSAVASEVYIVDLATSPATLVRGAANPVAVSTTSAIFNNIADLAVSPDGSRLLALNSNDGALTILSLADPASPIAVTRTAAFKRSQAAAAFDNAPFTMALRPPGARIRPSGTAAGSGGFDLAVGTIGIRAPQDQVVTDVQTAVDLVATGASPPVLKLNAVVAPFTPFTDIQHVIAPPHGSLAGFVFAVEGATGKVIVRSFADLQ